MIDKEFCQFCAVPLRPDETETPIAEKDDKETTADHDEMLPEEPGEQPSVETFTAHCHSEKHSTNVFAHEQFVTLKKDHYEPLKEKMYTLLKEMKEFVDENFNSNLRMTVQEMEKEIEANERSVNQFMLSAEWKEGASRIEQDMLEQMESQILKVPLLLKKEQERVAREQREQAAQFQTPADDDELSDEDAGSQSDEEISKKVNAKEAKERYRQLKKERKAKRRHRSNRQTV